MKKRVSLVLSSGGARGMAHIGVIEALEAQGFEITSIAGSSIGALVGGIYASGKLNDYRDWVRTLDKMSVFRLFDFTLSMQGFVRGHKVFKELEQMIGECNIEDLPIPLRIIAADIHHHQERVISEGSMFKAIRASVAIPTILTPLDYLNGQLVDGGVVNPLPIEHVQRQEGDLLVAVNLNANIPYESPVPSEKEKRQIQMYYEQMEAVWDKWLRLLPFDKERQKTEVKKEVIKKKGFFDIMNHSLDLMQDKLSQMILHRFQPDMVIDISKDACDAFEFFRAEEMIDLGKTSFEKTYKAYLEQNGNNQEVPEELN